MTRITDSISRWWQSMGFGIQSPADFAFLHDVIKEQLPYYCYEEMRKRYPQATDQEHYLARLLFRIANSIKPSEVITNSSGEDIYKAYLMAAPRGNALPLLFLNGESTLSHYHGYSAIILSDIQTHNCHLWQQILKQNCITYDMRNIGIALFSKERYSEHYKI